MHDQPGHDGARGHDQQHPAGEVVEVLAHPSKLHDWSFRRRLDLQRMRLSATRRCCSTPRAAAALPSGARRADARPLGCRSGPPTPAGPAPYRRPGIEPAPARESAWICTSTRPSICSAARRARAPAGGLARPRDAVRRRRERLGAPVMVKAQVKTAAAARPAASSSRRRGRARARAGDILGMDIKGHVTRQVLVTEASEIAEEYYVSFLLDRANRTFLAMASVEGGMEIEQVAKERPGGAGDDPRGRPRRAARGEGARDRRRGEVPRRGPDEVLDVLVGAVGRVRRGGRDPRRGQPAGQDGDGTGAWRSTAR